MTLGGGEMLRYFIVAWRENVHTHALDSGAFAGFVNLDDDYFSIGLKISCRQTETSNRIDDFS